MINIDLLDFDADYSRPVMFLTVRIAANLDLSTSTQRQIIDTAQLDDDRGTVEALKYLQVISDNVREIKIQNGDVIPQNHREKFIELLNKAGFCVYDETGGKVEAPEDFTDMTEINIIYDKMKKLNDHEKSQLLKMMISDGFF